MAKSRVSFHLDLADLQGFVDDLQSFCAGGVASFFLEEYELDAWDLPDDAARRSYRDRIGLEAQEQMSAAGSARALLVDHQSRILSLFWIADDGDFAMFELPLGFRVPIGDSERGKQCRQTANKYERQSSARIFAFRLHPDGSQTRLGAEDAAKLVEKMINYILTDHVCIFWDPDTLAERNIPAMNLIRDAEIINYEIAVNNIDYIEEVSGDAIIIEGFDQMDAFAS